MKEITRLLGSWPLVAAPVDGNEQLRAYMLAVEDWQDVDVAAAVTSLIKGNAPGVNPNFLPTPAALGAECRRLSSLRFGQEARAKARQPQLPPPEAPHTPELRGKFKDVVDGIVASLSIDIATEEAALMERREASLQRTNERFAPHMSPDAVAHRLGYSVGDREGEADAA